MIKEQFSDKSIFDAQVRQFDGYELSKLIVVVGEEDVPINIFSHGNFDFLLFIPFDVIDLTETHEVQEQNKKNCVELSG